MANPELPDVAFIIMTEPNELRSAFARALVGIIDLELAGNLAGAIGALREFWERHRAEDVDGWLANAVAFQHAGMLRDSGDLQGALGLLRSVQARPEDRMFYLLTGYCIATVLDRLGQPREAFKELTFRFQHVGGPPSKGDLGAVTLCADLAAELGEEPHVRSATRHAVAEWGIELTQEESRHPERLRAALAAANEISKTAADRDRHRLGLI